MYAAKELLSHFPDACREPYALNEYPLHYFCSKEEDFSSEILTCLDIYPDACELRRALDDSFALKLLIDNIIIYTESPGSSFSMNEDTLECFRLLIKAYPRSTVSQFQIHEIYPSNPGFKSSYQRNIDFFVHRINSLNNGCRYSATILRLVFNSFYGITNNHMGSHVLKLNVKGVTYESVYRKLNWQSRPPTLSLLTKLAAITDIY